MQGLDVGGVRTQTVFGDNELEMRVILAQRGDEAFGSIALTVIFLRAIVFHNGFGHQRNDFAAVGMEKHCPQQLMIVRHRPVAMDFLEARVTVNGLRGKIPRAIECQEIIAVKEHHLFQGFAALELPKNRPKHGAKRLRGHRIEALTHRRVTRDVLNAVDGGQIALHPLFVKGEEGGGFEGKHGKP